MPPGEPVGPPPGAPPGGLPPGYGQAPPGPGWGEGVPPGGPPKKSPLPIILGVVAVAVLVGGAVWFVARGDDDSSSDSDGVDLSDEEQDYVDAITAAAQEEPTVVDEDQAFDADAIPCLSEATVYIVGVDALADVGTPEEIRDDPDLLEELDDKFGESETMSREDAEKLYDTLERCVDFEEEFIREGIPGRSEDDVRCLVDNVDEGALKELMIQGFMGEEGQSAESERQFKEAGDSCGLT